MSKESTARELVLPGDLLDPGTMKPGEGTYVHDGKIFAAMLGIKSVAFGTIVSVICCKKGFYATGGARGVGEATARAVVSSIVAIFAADYLLTTVLTDL